MNNIETAILFNQKIINEELTIMIPVRILYGYSEEETVIFNDYLSNQTFLNSDLCITPNMSTFNFIVPLKELQKTYKTKNLEKILEHYFADISKNVFYYTEESNTMEVAPIDDFDKMYGVKITYPSTKDVKDIIDKVLKGEITEESLEEEESNINITNQKISDICASIKKRVIAQDMPIKQIATAIYRNYMFEDPKMKSNIFIYGPSGSGKTEIVRTIGNMFNIPVLIEDMTRYTSAGFKGSNLDDLLVKIYYNANENLSLAEKSIVVLDEIDKKASDGNDQNSFQKGDVLKSLLKIIEGGVFDIDIGKGEILNFDTSKLTIITCGAFTDIYTKNKPVQTKQIGFNTENIIPKQKKDIDITDFTNYGMTLEFMGRMDTIVRLNELTKEDLIEILKNSEISPIKIYLNNLKNIGININIPESLYDKIATNAISYKTGARALKVVVDDMFQDILYTIFDNPNEIEALKIKEEILEDKKSYSLTKKLTQKNKS